MQLKKIPTKGSKLSPQSKAIITHLQQHGRCTFDQLHQLFKEPAYFRSNHENPHKPNPDWLRARLVYMRVAGHVSRELHDGAMYYVPGDQQRDQVARQPLQAPSDSGVVTPPRRAYIMGSTAYRQQPSAPYRAGSMDFANCPSIESGQAKPFVPGKFNHG